MSKVYTFICPECGKRFRTDEPGEPCCTGLSEMRHEHDLTVMHLLRVDDRLVSPIQAAVRAAGPLIIARG